MERRKTPDRRKIHTFFPMNVEPGRLTGETPMPGIGKE